MSLLLGALICSVALATPFTIIVLGFFAYRACSVPNVDEHDPAFVAWDGPVVYRDYTCSTELPGVRISAKENYIPDFAPLPQKTVAPEVARRLGKPAIKENAQAKTLRPSRSKPLLPPLKPTGSHNKEDKYDHAADEVWDESLVV